MRLFRAALLCFALCQAGVAWACPQETALASALAAAQQGTEQRVATAARDWEDLVRSVQDCADPAVELRVLGAWTDAAMRVGESTQALDAERERHARSAARQDLRVQAEAAARLGSILTERGEMDLAQRRLEEAATLWTTLDDKGQAADARSRLSRLHRRTGDYLQALREEQEALRLRRLQTPPPSLWRSILNIAVLYEQLEQQEESRRRYAEALDETERSASDAETAVVLASFAGFLNDLGATDAAQARALATRALAIEQRLQRPVQTAGAWLQLGRAEMNLQHLEEADRSFAEAWAQAERVAHPAMLAHVGFRWGELALAQGRTKLALERLEAARRAYESQGNRHRLAKVHLALEAAHRAAGNPLAAAQSGREHYRLRDALLGSPAMARIGELLREFELGEERLRNAQLEREKAEAELRLLAERKKLQNLMIAVLMVASILALFGWRHYTVERLYRVLRERNRVVQAQAEQLKLANDQLTEQSRLLYQHSITDPLTGVANRARGMQLLEGAAAESAGSPGLAVLIVDIDHFKAINDRHGHPVGDQALIAVAEALHQGMPAGGSLARFGGEEFLVVLRQTNPAKARALAEQLRQRVEAVRLATAQGELSLTISIGIACARAGQPDTSARGLYAAADAALYTAKREGRNRICMA
ncbi:MAG: diguanylate cyclase [Xanthomonadales bacterium]|jgi:diguanylate cyclase (GGDEF)-like protein|nr:diguanylate cyclase [Xanthomonadales bacterium]